MRRKWILVLAVLLLLVTACGDSSKDPVKYKVTVLTGIPSDSGKEIIYNYTVENSFLVPELTRRGYAYKGLQYYNSVFPSGTRLAVSYDMALSAVWEALEQNQSSSDPEESLEGSLSEYIALIAEEKMLEQGPEGMYPDEILTVGPPDSLSFTQDLPLMLIQEEPTIEEPAPSEEHLVSVIVTGIYEEDMLTGEIFSLTPGNYFIPAYTREGYAFQGLTDGISLYPADTIVEVSESITVEAVWEIIEEITVTINSLYDGEEETVRSFQLEPGSYIIPSFERDGYIFLGLTDGISLYEADTVAEVSEDLSLTAVWQLVVEEAIVEEDNVTAEPETTTVLITINNVFNDAGEETALTLQLEPGSYIVPGLERDGFVFLGLSDGINLYEADTIAEVSEDLTLDAVWQLVVEEAIVEEDNVTAEPEITTVLITINNVFDDTGEETALTLQLEPGSYIVPSLERDGYVFLGLSDGTNLYEADTIAEVSENLTLTAVWQMIEFTVTINNVFDDAGEETALTLQLEPGSYIVPGFERDGYVFLGLSDGTNLYEADTIAKVSEDLTLTAVWQLIEFTVKINGIFDDAGEETALTFQLEPGSYIVPSFERDGYIFLGLTDGISLYEADTVAEVSEDLTLTAVWQLVVEEAIVEEDNVTAEPETTTVLITINNVFDDTGEETALTFQLEPGSYIVPSFERDGYVFLGLTDGISLYEADTIAEVSEDLSLTAVWQLIEFTVTINNVFNDTGEETALTFQLVPGSYIVPSLERDGYIFLGLSDGTNLYEADTVAEVSEDLSLTAVWQLVVDEAIVEEDNVTAEPEISTVLITINNVFDAAGEETALTLQLVPGSYIVPGLERDGYVFLGLTDGISLYEADTIAEVSEDLSLTAVWQLIEFTVTINKVFDDAGEETALTFQLAPGSYIVPSLERDGYIFLGLTDGISLYEADTIAEASEDLSLDAVWQLVVDEAIVEEDNVTAGPENTTILITINNVFDDTGEETALTFQLEPGSYIVPSLERDGYVFLGLTDGISLYEADTIAEASDDLSLDAVWQLIEFTVTINGIFDDTGEENALTFQLEPGSYIVPSLERDGYIFLGLSDGTNLYEADTIAEVSEDLTLDAVWQLVVDEAIVEEDNVTAEPETTTVLITINHAFDDTGEETALTLQLEPGSYIVPSFERDGYVFLGLSDDTDFYPLDDTVTVSSDMTLYAEWDLLPEEERTVTLSLSVRLFDLTKGIEADEDYCLTVKLDGETVPELCIASTGSHELTLVVSDKDGGILSSTTENLFLADDAELELEIGFYEPQSLFFTVSEPVAGLNLFTCYEEGLDACWPLGDFLVFIDNTLTDQKADDITTSGPAGIEIRLYGHSTFPVFLLEDLNVDSLPEALPVLSYTDGQPLISLDLGRKSPFSRAKALRSITPELLKNNQQLTDLSYAFYQCASLESIPEDLFEGMTEAVSFRCAFSGCSALQIIPSGLFAETPEAKDFSSVFSSCSALGKLPAGLFSNTSAEDLSYAFYECVSLTTITGVFNQTSLARNYSRVFAYCDQLKTIPSGLFSDSTNATDFSYAFYSCKSLKTINTNTFTGAAAASDFTGTFGQCTALTSLPVALFNGKTPNAVSFKETFAGCAGLKKLPANFFSSLSKAETFEGCFYGCTSLTTIGNSVFKEASSAVDFTRTFSQCSSLTTTGSSTFQNCSSARYFIETFSGCPSLRTIGQDIFKGCENAESFKGCFKGAASVESVPSGLFSDSTRALSYRETFSGCASLNEVPEELFNRTAEDFFNVFYGCPFYDEADA